MLTTRTPAARRHRLPLACTTLAAIALANADRLEAAPVTTVAWENLVGTDTPPAAALVDADGTTLLGVGSPAAGDGAVVALGYFTGAATAAVFTGEWVPLTGPQAANIAFQRTTVGDASTGGDLPAGFLTLQTDFDAADSAVYQRIPAVGTRLAVAVYNRGTIAGSTHFNIATSDAWRWDVPAGPLPMPPVYINLALHDPLWFGGTGTALRTAVPTSSFPGDAARAPARLVNISTRAQAGTGDNQLIPGFVIAGTGTCRLLVRAVGPTLAGDPFDIPGALDDPVLRVVRRLDAAVAAENDDWSNQPDPAAVASAAAAVGAFPLPPGSRDAALLADLGVSPGGYTVNIEGTSGAAGIVLAEAYLTDASPDAPTELVNISSRGWVGSGDAVLTAGFVVGAGGPRRLLIRAVGPTLGAPPFGLSGVLADPMLRVVPSSDPGTIAAANDDWSDAGQASALSAAGAQVGAFALAPGSKDAALLFDLPAAGVDRGYTVQVFGAADSTGLAIVEIYELP